MKNIMKKLEETPVIPVLTFDDEKQALQISQALIDGGLRTLEITLRTDNSLKCIEKIRERFPDILIGAGTILKKEQITQIKNIGVDFAVSPGSTQELLDMAKKEDFPYLPASSTPSEVMKLMEQGIYFQKFFHASHSGGAKMLKTFSSLFPQVKFCPTGGITQKDYKEYLNLNNVLCLGGSWIVSDDDTKNFDYEKLKNKVQTLVQNIKG